MVRAAAAVVAASFVLTATASAADVAPWNAAGNVRLALSDAQAALVLGDNAGAKERIAAARADVGLVLGSNPAALRRALAALDTAGWRRPSAGDGERHRVDAILATAYAEAGRAAARGDVATARSWLLVREFRPPTRFSRAADDATVALDGLADGSVAPRSAASAVRRDLLDTYDARLRTSLTDLREADDPRVRRVARRARCACARLLVDPLERPSGTARWACHGTPHELVRAGRRRRGRRTPPAGDARSHRTLARRIPRRTALRRRARETGRSAPALPAARSDRVRKGRRRTGR